MLLYWIDRSSLSGTRAIIDVMSLLYYIDIILLNRSERSSLSRSKLVSPPKSKPERGRERESHAPNNEDCRHPVMQHQPGSCGAKERYVFKRLETYRWYESFYLNRFVCNARSSYDI